jgi:predicted nucleic acid-binding protein
MSGNSILIDTNIALFLFSGNKSVAEILEGSQLHISFITQLELLGYKNITSSERKTIEKFISQCHIIDINDGIKKEVVHIRQKHNLKLPDCIIAATSISLDIPLLTADKDFKKITELNLVLFEEE